MHVADAQKALDVGLVRVGVERVDQEDHCVHFFGGDTGRDLSVPAQRPREQPLDAQPRRLRDPTARRAGGENANRGETLSMAKDKSDEVVLLLVVRDEGERGHERGHRHWRLSPVNGWAR